MSKEEIPEDPVNSTSDVSHFSDATGLEYNVQHFFFNFGVHFDTFKAGA